MALQKQIMEIPLAGGLQAKADPKVVQPGAMLQLENGEFDELGAVKKRNGYNALTRSTDGTAIAQGRAVFSVRDELVMLDGANLYTHSLASGRWETVGELKTLNVRTKRIASGTSSAGYGTLGYANGVALIAWKDSAGELIATVLDTATGAIISSAAIRSVNGGLTGAGAFDVATSGDYIYVVSQYDDGVQAYIGCHVLNTRAPTSFTTNNLILGAGSALAATGGIAAVKVNDAGKCAAVYAKTTAGQDYPQVITFDSTGLVAGPTASGQACDNGTKMGLFNDEATGNIYVHWWAGTNNYGWALSSSLSSLFVPVSLAAANAGGNAVAYKSGSSVKWFWNNSSGAEIRTASINAAGSVTSASARWLGGAQIVSHWFTHTDNTGTHRLMAVRYYDTSATQYGQYLIGDDALPYASFLRNQQTQLMVQSKVEEVSDGVFWMFSIANYAADKYFPTVVNVDFSHKPEVAVLGENAHITGGQLWEYDGSNVFEHGFLQYPNAPSLTGATTTGSMDAGTYQVVAFFEWTDARGQIHRSAMSEPSTVTLGGATTGKITCVVNTLRLTHRSNVIVRVARTTTNGTQFYVDNSLSTANVTTANTVSIVITTEPDADDPLVYTDGGILDNLPPAPLFSIVRKGERLYGVDEDGKVWYTRRHVLNEAAAFADEFLTADINEEATGDNYKIAEMDGAVVVFGENSIQVISGDGPDETGANSDLQDPRVIASEVGTAPDSRIVKTDAGLFFKSKKGICLLSRSFQVDQSVGTPVEPYKSLTMSSAVVVPTKNQVRFGHSDGVALVFDYVAKAWAVFSNLEHADAAVWGDDYVLLRYDGTVWRQSDGYIDGDGASISISLRTPWLKLSGLQGFQRLSYASLLGEWRSNHSLTLGVYYDYAQASTESVTFSAMSVAQGYAQGDPLQIRHHLGRKCKAVMFEITDSAQDGTKEGPRLTSLSLEMGMKAGVSRQSKSRTF